MVGKGFFTVQMTARQLKFLEQRGARSHRGRGTFSRSVVLGRMLEALRLYLESSDPQMNPELSKEMYQVVIRLLPEPWMLKRYEIENLGGLLKSLLERSPEFMDEVRSAGVAPEALLAAVGKLTVAEKLTLVDHAVQKQAPEASASSPEER